MPTGYLEFFTAALIHVNYAHLIGNTLPFMVLGGMVLFSGKRKFIFTTIVSGLISRIGICFLLEKEQSTLEQAHLSLAILASSLFRHG